MLSANRSRLRHAALAAAGWVSLGAADALGIDRLKVTDIRPLLAVALDRGEAHGVLVGEAAQWTAEHFKTSAPIEIDVKTEKPLSRPGCMRLAITTTQDAVWDFNRKERASAPERKAFTWRINYCRDGSLPTGEAE